MRCAFPLLIALFFPGSAGTAQEVGRPMTVEDLFTIESLGTTVLSPDGEWVAAVVQRAKTAAETYRSPYLGGDERADVWLLPRRGGAGRNLTKGMSEASGYWGPVWSPDGGRIAMLSTRGGDNVRLYVWDRDSGGIYCLASQGVDLQASIGLVQGGTGPFVWVDPTTLLVALLPEGVVARRMEVIIRTARVAPLEWAKTEGGDEAAVSVLETGLGVSSPDAGLVELRRIDVSRGTSRLEAELPYDPYGSRIIRLSPDERVAAVLVGAGPVTMDRDHILGHERRRLSQLGLALLDGSTSVRWLDGGVYTGLGEWAPDGSALAVFGKLDEWRNETPGELFLLDSSGKLRAATPDRYTVSAAVWTADGKPVVLARPARGIAHEQPNESKGAQWLRIDGDGSVVGVAPGLHPGPGELQPTGRPNDYLGVAGGDLWRVDVAGGSVENLTESLSGEVVSIAFPLGEQRLHLPVTEAVVGVEDEGGKTYQRVPLAGIGPTRALPRPSSMATLEHYEPEGRIALFSENGPGGTFLWSGGGDSSEFTRILSRNEHLVEIADVGRMLFEYRGLDGDTLKGLLLLPPGHEPGQRHPLVAWVYAGSVWRDTLTWQADKNEPSPLNLLPLVSRGYAVLLPSMPLQPVGAASDPYLEIPKGVLTAVEKLIDMGIADPDRLAVMGHSYGGYSTFALVTYTSRFKAAIAMAGFSNLVSLYGQFDPRMRHTERPHENLFMPMLSEGGQARMGVPPWDDLWRYLRNSPLLFVDRVQTPVMIIGADQDFVTMTQGEEFFTALQRQGKRARFVRYWGEDHVISSPGNVRHFWNQIFDWLDLHLTPSMEGIQP